MADSTIDSNLILLFDNWRQFAEPTEVPPGAGFLDLTAHNVATPKYRPGTTIQVYNATLGVPGMAQLIYLQVGTQDATAIAAKTACVPDSATLWYQLTNDPDSCIKLPTCLGCYALSAITNAYWGWFWSAGVVPEDYVPAMGGNFLTNEGVAAGGFIFHACDAIVGIDVADTAPEKAAGFALAADA